MVADGAGQTAPNDRIDDRIDNRISDRISDRTLALFALEIPCRWMCIP